jgi:tetratricopeptide (TPR) repeat protein
MSFRLQKLAVHFSFGAVFMLAGLAWAAPLDDAQKLFRRTNYTGVISLLKPEAAQSAEACGLIGQSYLMLGNPDKAVEYLGKAIAIDPSRASSYLWLGRAYGRKAEIAFPLLAARDASKARANFEKAYDLDPSSPDAADDLFEFYLEAPGFLGGGFDKAAKVADHIAQRDPAEGVFAKARLAEQRKDYSTAEALLRRAVELAPKSPRRLLDLAVFLAKRGRYAESDAEFVEARQFAQQTPRVLFREASTYIQEKRKPEEARELLKEYLSTSTGPDDPSKEEAQKLLRRVSGS